MASKPLPPVGARGVILEFPFTRGFVVIGEEHFPARAENGEIETGRHVQVVAHDGEEVVIAPLEAQEAAAIEDKLRRQTVPNPTSRGDGTRLFCPRCGSDRVVEFGAKSQLDGKMPHKCEACNLEMGPLRSRLVLWLLTAISLVIAVGTLAFFAYDRLAGEGKASLGLLLAPGVFGAFAVAGFREMQKPVPRR